MHPPPGTEPQLECVNLSTKPPFKDFHFALNLYLEHTLAGYLRTGSAFGERGQ